MVHRLSTLSFLRYASILVVLALTVRLYKINNPIADWHSFRQADTASVTREYVKHGIDLLHPRYHDLSNVQSGENNEGKDNVEGWRMVEFPIVNGFLAFWIRLFKIDDLVLFSRLASVFASLGTLLSLLFLTKELFGKLVAVLTGAFFALLPYSVFYSRVILPEPFLLCAVLTSLLLYWYALEKQSKVLLLGSAFAFGIALLIKPMAIFFVPALIGLRVQKKIQITSFDMFAALFFSVAVAPLVLWREWIKQFPLGIPSSNWLYNGGGEGKRLSPVYNIRFRPAWFRWLFYERLTKLILGSAGIVLFLLGLLPEKLAQPFSKRYLFLICFGVGMLSYLIVFAAGNVQHDYYQTLLLPFICLVAGIGTARLIRSKFLIVKISAVAVIALTLFLSFEQVKGYYTINHPDIVVAGKRADELLPKDTKVIAPFNGDTAFLFQTNRTGWPIGFEIDEKISEGAQYYISVNYDDEARELEQKYKTVEKTAKYIIVELKRAQ